MNGDKSRPLASVALHDSENVCEDSLLYQVIDIYFDNEIYKYSGLTLPQFLSLPKEYTTYVVKNIAKVKNKEGIDTQNALNILNNSSGKKN